MRVLLIPGLLGSRLRHRGTGRVTWGTLGAMYRRPAWGLRGDDFHLRPGEENPNEADGVLDRLRLIPGLWGVDIYRRLRRALESRGHHVVPLGYDWRKSHVEAAARVPDADVAIAHSTGGFVLDLALRRGAKIPRSVWVGYPALGTFEAFKDLTRPFGFGPAGTKFRPSVAANYPSAFESLPRWPVVEGADAWDARVWAREKWGPFADAERPHVRTLYGLDDAGLLRLFAERLDAARRVHERLDGWPPGRHVVVMNDAIPTARTVRHKAPGDGNTVAESVLRGGGVEVVRVAARHRYLLAARSGIDAVLEWIERSR